MEHKVERTDGRGILAGDYLNQNRELTRQDWLEDCFPEWGTLLNQEIENFEVQKGSVALWWLGGPSWMLKTDEGAIFFIDVYSGPSHYTQYYYCGVCKQAGAETINWMRMNPQLIDPWKFNRLDAAFSTHHHQDHCDLYTVKAALQTTKCPFVGSPKTVEKLKSFDVPDERIITAHVGESIKFPGVEVEFLMNYDDTVIRTGDGAGRDKYENCCVSFLFKTSAGNIMFLGDTWYNDAYKAIGENYQVDVAIFDMGMNAPGARFVYPQDQDIKRYRYPNQSEGYNPEKSISYGEYARKYGKKN